MLMLMACPTAWLLCVSRSLWLPLEVRSHSLPVCLVCLMKKTRNIGGCLPPDPSSILACQVCEHDYNIAACLPCPPCRFLPFDQSPGSGRSTSRVSVRGREPVRAARQTSHNYGELVLQRGGGWGGWACACDRKYSIPQGGVLTPQQVVSVQAK